MHLPTIIVVASGGAIGAVLRFWVYHFSSTHLNNWLPFGTLFVNLTGSFFAGIAFAYFSCNPSFSLHKNFWMVGLLGAFTTYSTFAIESFVLLQGGKIFEAILSMILNLFGTIMLSACGYLLAQYFLIR
ncbi:MAG TPA: fluoride efflux transporter CrcB [Epsilonproteobacteria bacterium]|nr:fluoride efflux transporter CrcB [Campylobacterota bacterium]